MDVVIWTNNSSFVLKTPSHEHVNDINNRLGPAWSDLVKWWTGTQPLFCLPPTVILALFPLNKANVPAAYADFSDDVFFVAIFIYALRKPTPGMLIEPKAWTN